MDVMSVFAVVNQHVQVHARIHGELLQKLQGQLRIVDPKLSGGYFVRARVGKVVTPAQIDSNSGQNLIHGKREMAIARNAAFVSQGLMQESAKENGGVFHRVVAINADVAPQPKVHINAAMLGNMAEHMLEKRDLGIKVIATTPVQVDGQGDVGLTGFACRARGAGGSSSRSQLHIGPRSTKGVRLSTLSCAEKVLADSASTQCIYTIPRPGRLRMGQAALIEGKSKEIHERMFGGLQEMIAKSGVQIPPNCILEAESEFEEYENRKRLVQTFPAREKHANPLGNLQGGILSSMIDDTMGPLSFAAARNPTTTINLSVNFLRAVRCPGLVRVEARVTGLGRRVMYLDASAFDAKGRLVATATSSVLILSGAAQ